MGQNVVTRRTYRVSGDAGGATGEHTAGLVQIVEAKKFKAYGDGLTSAAKVEKNL